MASVPGSTNPYRAYVPRLLLSWLTEEPHVGARGIEGSMVFVDVAGFTALSERLAKQGKIGAEELTDALGHCFASLLQVAYEHGGSLIKFGGDALLLFFDGDGHQPRACRAAVGMRRGLRHAGRIATSAGRVSVRMSAGVHSGTFHFFLVGSSHRELVVTGPAATATVAMENAASAGQIVLSPETAEALPPSIVGPPLGPGRLLRRSPYEMRRAIDLEERPIPLLEYCLPAPIREQVASGVDDSEHRNVTVGFVHFEGTDDLIAREGLESAMAALSELILDIQAATDELGVTFLGSDIDRDGGKVILAGGTPVAHGDDEERMLRALVRIAEVRRRLPVRIGVNRGQVFAGHVGPHYRRTYTVMGDAVNLAARVMARAGPGQVLATETVTDRLRSRFVLHPLPPFSVKGKSHPVIAASVEGLEASESLPAGDAASSPMVGRERELAAIEELLSRAAAGRGALVDIVGEPGIGKSRLLAEVDAIAAEAGRDVVRIACDSYASAIPYGTVRSLVRQVMGVDAADGERSALNALLRACRTHAPHLEPMLPLVALALDLPMPETAQTSSLAPEFRKVRLEAVAAELLAASRPEGAVALIEDVHWMDEASCGVLAALVSSTAERPWLICVSRRDIHDGFVPAEAGTFLRLSLKPLSQDAAETLMRAEGTGGLLSPHDIEELRRRGGGNPLFLRELVRSAESAGGVDALPESLDQLLVAQIDRLSAADRRLLRYAAVLGTLVEAGLLQAAVGAGYDPAALARLGDFLAPAGSRSWRFRHALIRDASYEGLPYRTRRLAHARVADAVRGASASPEDEAERLSFHFFHADRAQDAWKYSLIAGERATEKYANVEAAVFLERAVASARKADGVSRSELARVHELLGDARRKSGKYPDATAAYRRARQLVSGDLAEQARLLVKNVIVAAQLGRHSDALRLTARAQTLLDRAGAGPAHPVRVEAMVERVVMLQSLGRTAAAITSALAAAEAARAGGHRRSLARAYTMLDWAYVETGRFEEAVHYPLALAIYEELNDLKGQAMVHMQIGAAAYWQGRWDDAVAAYERGRDAELRGGDLVFAALGTLNVAEIRADQGRLDEAEALFLEALPVFHAAGDVTSEAFAKAHLGRIKAYRGEYDEAFELLSSARDCFAQTGFRTVVMDAEAKLLECRLLRGEAAEVLAAVQELLADLDPAEGAAVHAPALHRVRGYSLLLLDRIPDAREAFSVSLSLSRERAFTYGVALALQATAAADHMEHGSARPELEAERDALMRRLGVVQAVAAVNGGNGHARPGRRVSDP